MVVSATLAKAHDHRSQGVNVQQPHLTRFKTSCGAAAVSGGSPTGTRSLFNSSFFQQRHNYKEWAGGARFKSGSFLYCKYKGGIKESNVSSSC